MSAGSSPQAGAGWAGTQPIAGLGAVADLYHGFILDQWGVLHDGKTPYPGALDCLKALRESGKRVVVLSNSGKRNDYNVALMSRIAFTPDLYDEMISAGEDAWRGLASRGKHGADDFYAGLGRRCYATRRPGDSSFLDGVDIDLVEDVGQADFLLLIGDARDSGLLEAYESLIAQGLARGLPMVCANPDTHRVDGGKLAEAIGLVAEEYERRGGRVQWHGKPHPPIYRSCLASLGLSDKARILAVGDSLGHDIEGASRFGCDSALVADGIHGPALGVSGNMLPSDAAWRGFIADKPVRPTYLMGRFVW